MKKTIINSEMKDKLKVKMDRKVEHLKKPNVRKVNLKKLSIVEHRKRRKKKQGVRVKTTEKDVEELSAKKRKKKEEKVSLTKTMLLLDS